MKILPLTFYLILLSVFFFASENRVYSKDTIVATSLNVPVPGTPDYPHPKTSDDDNGDNDNNGDNDYKGENDDNKDNDVPAGEDDDNGDNDDNEDNDDK